MPRFEQIFFAGSGLKHLQKDKFRNHLVAVPSAKCMKAFNKYVEKLYEEKTLYTLENKELSEIRDFLIPMLMNGRVKVGKSSEKTRFQKVAKYEAIDQKQIAAAEESEW